MINPTENDSSFVIRASRSSADLRICARMMARTTPWNVLFFSEEQCMANLSSSSMRVYLAMSPSEDCLAFLATLPLGLGSEPLLEYLCVHEDHRNTGIGTRLVTFFEEQLYAAAANVYLFVSDINPGALRLYERLGYRRVGVLPDYNVVGQTEFLYRKYRRPRQEPS
jgi:GNAT superfamily N-acetyltransferase